MAVYGTACYLVWRLAPAAWHKPGLALAAALVAAIGLSRVLLQVHFASDVAAGWAISLAWMILCVGLAEGLRASGRDAGQRVHSRASAGLRPAWASRAGQAYRPPAFRIACPRMRARPLPAVPGRR